MKLSFTAIAGMSSRILLVGAFSTAYTVAVFSQPGGGGGGVDRGTRKSSSPPKTPRNPKPPKDSGRRKTPPAKPARTSLNLAVTEPGATICIPKLKTAIFRSGCAQTGLAGEPIKIAMLGAGNYDVIVRKTNFKEVRRTITVAPGANTFSFTLEPSVAFLTVQVSNLRDANIEIVGVGTFSGSVVRHPVAAGAYQVKVSRRGYRSVSETVQANVLGMDNEVYINLKAIPVGPLLANAQKHLKSGSYDQAAEAAAQVLEIEPANSRAHLVKGTALFYLGSADAASHIEDAVRLGETFVMPVGYFRSEGQTSLLQVSLQIERDLLQFRADRKDLTLTIKRGDMTELAAQQAGAEPANLTFGGWGEYGGKRLDRRVKIYSESARLTADRSVVFCSTTPIIALRCSSDIGNLFRIIRAWRAKELPN